MNIIDFVDYLQVKQAEEMAAHDLHVAECNRRLKLEQTLTDLLAELQAA